MMTQDDLTWLTLFEHLAPIQASLQTAQEQIRELIRKLPQPKDDFQSGCLSLMDLAASQVTLARLITLRAIEWEHSGD